MPICYGVKTTELMALILLAEDDPTGSIWSRKATTAGLSCGG
jgi:hypothetical protein